VSADVEGFPPIAASDAERLVLGSMPSVASLRAGQYYAHPRNAFWRIVSAHFGLPDDLSYSERCRALVERRVAVWDTLAACTRAGSLDSDIVESSIVPNDFESFLRSHPHVALIGCNGTRSMQVFERRVRPTLPADLAAIPVRRLPSTSPANASYSFERKLAAWRAFFDGRQSP